MGLPVGNAFGLGVDVPSLCVGAPGLPGGGGRCPGLCGGAPGMPGGVLLIYVWVLLGCVWAFLVYLWGVVLVSIYAPSLRVPECLPLGTLQL